MLTEIRLHIALTDFRDHAGGTKQYTGVSEIYRSQQASQGNGRSRELPTM
jgi:hypothetical protein